MNSESAQRGFRRPVRDFQRSAVYRWQSEVVLPRYPTGIPEEGIELVLCNVELLTGTAVPWRVNNKARAWAWGGTVITLPGRKHGSWAWSVPVVLHEAAHVTLVHHGLCDAHGPKFMGLFLLLLKHCGGRIGREGVAAWAAEAMQRGVRVESMKHLVEQNVPSLEANRLDARPADDNQEESS